MRPTTTTVLALTAVLTLGLTGPASAEQYTGDDTSTTGHGSDLLSLAVDFGSDDVTVVSTHQNLRRSYTSGSSGRIFLDTDRDDRGPEYVLLAGFYEGTDYQLLRTDGFGRSTWGRAVHGGYSMSIDYRSETVEVSIDRATLGGPDELRVAMRVSGTRRDGTSHGLVDWFGEPRDTTPWLARG